jgi:hypothetical protein
MGLGSRQKFYEDIAVTNSGFPSKATIIVPFQATHIILAPRNLKVNEIITYSFQGVDIDGQLLSEDGPFSFDGVSEAKIWFRTNQIQNASAAMRVWAWAGGGA